MKPRKNEKRRSSLKVSPNTLKNKKEKLLARWTDGLFYFVKVIRVSESNKTCSVEFEDKSTAQVHFKDLLEAHDDGDAECHYCGDPEPAPANAMVTCSNCERVYHQYCHIPRVADEEIVQKFVCRICVFASCAQTGGAKTTGHLAEKFAVMKQSLPYELKQLTWDASHTSNVEQMFCYCGGPGCWYNKMLQCCRCRQWYHEACLQCLKEQLLVGDHFYVFACAHCNHGKEFIQRMDMKWLDIVYVSLFHLTMTMATRYVDVEDVVTCIMNHSSSFRLKDLLNGHHGNWDSVLDKVLSTLRENKDIFICAGELRKKNTLYGPRERVPRAPRSFCVPGPNERVTRESLLQAVFSSKKITFSPSKLSSPVNYISSRGGAKKCLAPASSPRVRESKIMKLARVKSEHNYCTPLKCPDGRRGACRSDSPSSTTSSSTSDTVDADMYDANNNSPSKQAPPPSASSPSPLPSNVDSSEDEDGGSDKDAREEETRSRRTGSETRRGRSRSSSSVRDVKHRNKNRLNGRSRDKRPRGSRDKREATPEPKQDLTLDESSEEVEEEEEERVGKKFWSLDIAIPHLASYSGENHPFLTEFEQESLRRRRQHFERELDRLSSVMASKSGSDGFTSILSKGQGPTVPLGVTGFRGELASLVTQATSPASSSDQRATSSCSGTPRSSPGGITLGPLKPRRSLNTSSSISCDGNGSVSKSSTPVVVNGVKISPVYHHKLPAKNGTLTPTSSSNKSSPTSPLSGRLARNQRSGGGSSQGDKLSPVTGKRARMDDRAAQKRAQALKRCLKNLTPTCGFHFPVLETTHPAVADSTTQNVGGNGERSPSQFSRSSSSSPVKSSKSSSPLQDKPVNGSAGSSRLVKSERGHKRSLDKFTKVDSGDGKKRNGAPQNDQENVRRSHRSRSIVNRFQAALDGGDGLMAASSSNSHGVVNNIADQYEVISLRVGRDGKVEYLIDWGQ